MNLDFCKMFSGKTVVLLGAGVSNMPLAQVLTEAGAHLVVRDRKNLEALGEAGQRLQTMGAQLILGENYLENIEGDYLFRSPGFRPDLPQLLQAQQAGCVITSEMELFLQHAPCPVVGVTGSDGKSTTTTLVSKILAQLGTKDRKVFLGGNIGEPLLHRINDMTAADAVAAELSSFQLMGIDASVTVAVIKNVTPNHLNWHIDMDEYRAAKANILSGCRGAVLNYDDSVCRTLGESCDAPILWFSRSPIPVDFMKDYAGGVYPKNGYVTLYDSKTDTEHALFAADVILLPGEHNLENYSTAVAAVWSLAETGADELARAAETVAGTFGGVRHRMELVREANGVRYYNSSIDSSPTRTAAAISAHTCPIRIICGGYDKQIPFAPLAKALISHGNVQTVVLTGATMEKIKKAMLEEPGFAASGIELICKPDFEEAVRCAAQSARPGDAVLLSPACASFDAFVNFEKRGERFSEIVNSL